MPGLHDLTPSQREAVEQIEGPLLILAGPGSGKTRVITRRIAHMVEQGVDPRQILAITFTNKAASEMSQRVAQLLPGSPIWVSTFHRFCARILRQRSEAVGLKPNFTICDTGDQRQLVRQAMHELDIDAIHYPPARIASQISRAKNDLKTAEEFVRSFEESIGDHMQAVIARVYPEYQRSLLRANSVDFDDLLLHVVSLLNENPELRRELDARFRYILVDEYQDTNIPQYQIVTALSQDHPNLCVTGDPDQSIYGWRGARIENILRFESDFPHARVVRLEQNFRSTKEILRAADSLIRNNVYRKHKDLLTENPLGESVQLLHFQDEQQETDFIARDIRQQVEAGERTWSDFAIFYRVNALSRELELALSRHRVPYQVAAGVAFYDRAEIKDMLGFLRLIANPSDETAFRRVVNTPPRGIGKTTQSRLIEWARREGFPLLEAASRAQECPNLSKRAVNALKRFASLMADCSLADAGSVEQLLRIVVDKTGYVRAWRGSRQEQELQRLANVEELMTAARQYDRAFPDNRTLEGFLEETSLVNDVDSLSEEGGHVTLMTLHAAKGLEFPVVYLLAVEQNLIPHERSLRRDDLRELEEERRLLFVGMTRAMERLFLTQTYRREFRGRPLHTIPSDFLREMDLVRCDHSDRDWEPESQWMPVSGKADLPRRDSETEQSRDTTDSSASPIDRRLLMTGADLLNGTARAASIPQGFAVGDLVRHPRYGRGRVTEVSGFSKKRTVTVEFEQEARVQTFRVAQCPLQPIGTR